MDDTEERFILLVEDAGVPEVNGEYVFDLMHNGQNATQRRENTTEKTINLAFIDLEFLIISPG
jgi:hypothetical protein